MLGRWIKLISGRRIANYKPQRLPGKFDNVVIAMSSGVDSSVAAALFAKEFPNARGIYMQNWSKSQSLTDPSSESCYERDWKDVVKVADHLKLPVDRVNFERDYWIDVFEPMLEGYTKGWTPNPDIACNKFVKFGKLVQHLDTKFGKNNYWLVTGHYSRILESEADTESHLLRSYYPQKDQSYYLSHVDPKVLPRLLFPIGHLSKPEVRQLAKELALPSANKPDSQGICFVNNSQQGKFKNFLEHYLVESKGDIVTVDLVTKEKRKWGEHKGLWSYTIGQKIGLSMPQGDPRYAGAWYVSEKLQDLNELVIVQGVNNPALFKDRLQVQDFTFQANNQSIVERIMHSAVRQGQLTMQYRSLQEPVPVLELHFSSERLLDIKLAGKQRAMAPGQNCCLYIGNRVLGSGTIRQVAGSSAFNSL